MDHQRQLANAGQSQQAEYPDVVSAAQSLISALTQTLNQSTVTPRSQVQVQVQGQQPAVQEQRQTDSTIDQEMGRGMRCKTAKHYSSRLRRLYWVPNQIFFCIWKDYAVCSSSTRGN
ncbi:unnamed protein product [Leuciscus chuanchicus]